MSNSNSNRAITSSITKGWRDVEAAAESAATIVTLVVGLLKKLFRKQCSHAFKMSQTNKKIIGDWGVTSYGRRQKATRSDRWFAFGG